MADEVERVARDDARKVLSDMLDKRRKWLASCERTLELLAPEWALFEARNDPSAERSDVYVSRLYADHFSEARTHRKEIAALETALSYLKDQTNGQG